MINQLPRHSGSPFDPWLSSLDFGTCSGLEVPFNGQVLNRQDGLQLRTTTPPFIAYQNTEIDTRLHDERHRWPIDGPAWMLSMSCDASYSFACKRHPSLGVPRGILYDLFFEDADLLRQERCNYSHGNAFRLVVSKKVNDSGSMDDIILALHPVGPFLNVLQLSRVVQQTPSTSPKYQLLPQSAIDISSTILDISSPTIHYRRCDRLVTVTTTSQFVFFIRLRTEDCRNPQIELLHQINLGAQPFPAVCNPLIVHECSIASDDGHITIYDASTCSESYTSSVDSSESVWLRQAYTAHPRILHIASRRRLQRLDLRTDSLVNDVADSLVYHHDPSAVITAFSSDLHDPFSVAVATWDHLSLFDERYTARPVIRWQHHRQKCPITHIEISTGNEKNKTMMVFGHGSSLIDVYRYSNGDNGTRMSLSSPQQIDMIADAQIRGLAVDLSPEVSRCYRLTEMGTVFCSEYRLVDDTIDYGEPCPTLASEDPLSMLSSFRLAPYNFIDFAKPVQEIVDSHKSGKDELPMLGEKELIEFMDDHQEQIMGFVMEWRSYSELYRFLRSELNMTAVSRSLDVYNAVNDIVERFQWATRLIPGMSDQESSSTWQTRTDPRDFLPLCMCSLSSISDCQPSADCSYPNLCQALLRSAVCVRSQILSLDLDNVWSQVKSDYVRSGRSNKKSVDLSNDLDALLSFLNANASEEATEKLQVENASVDVEDEFSVAQIFESLKQSWENFTQSDMINDEPR